MRFLNIFLFVAVIIAAVTPFPYLDEEEDSQNGIDLKISCARLGNEQKCAINCFIRGFIKGGWCDERNMCMCYRLNL
uniref:Venom polypeptide n=1 Tax=Dolopus genitalis TaxID=2488630 RepID=A0A3G5BIE8_DOLGE|nr:venom polypeptide [Dolopus genitalis]